MPLVPHVPAAEAPEHAALVVALDAGDLEMADLGRAETLVASCPGCAALRDDLAAIRDALAVLPVPARRRDFRLTEEDAIRLRPSGWRRLAGWLGAPGTAVRPLATGLATLGIAGLLLTAGLSAFGGPAALAPMSAEDQAAGGEPLAGQGTRTSSETESTDPEVQPVAPGEVPAPGLAGEPSPAALGSGDPPALTNDGEAREYGSGGKDAAVDASATPGPPAPVVVSVALLAAGLALFVASVLARRRTA
jgi:hypothetical protein